MSVKTPLQMSAALEILVEHRITGLPVVDDDWILVRIHDLFPSFLTKIIIVKLCEN